MLALVALREVRSACGVPERSPENGSKVRHGDLCRFSYVMTEGKMVLLTGLWR